MRELPEQGVLIEFRRVGNSVKVSAIDQYTGTEISIVGPHTASEADLSRVAVQKLNYVMAKKK